MTKNKNGTVAVLDAPTLSVADFDSIDVDALIAESESAPIEVNVNAAPSEEVAKVEALVPTFDSLYAADPLREEWRAFGEKDTHGRTTAHVTLDCIGTAHLGDVVAWGPA